MKKIIFILLFCLTIVFSVGCTSSEEKAQAYYQSAKNYYDKKEYQKSLIELKNALKINPKLADAYYLRGKINERQKQWKAMYVNMSQANKLDPMNVLAIVDLGKIDLLSGNITEARKKLDEASNLEPDHVEVLTLSAAINYKQSLTDETNQVELLNKAYTDIERVIDAAPENFEAISLYVSMTLPEKNYNKVIEVIEKGKNVASDADKKKYSLLLIKVYAVQGKKTEVIRLFNELIFDEPENLTYRQALALYLARLQDTKGAKQVLRDAITANPDNAEAKIMLASYLANQDIDEAVNELKQQIADSQGDQNQLKFALAELYQKKGDKEKAVDLYANIQSESDKESEILLAKISQARIALSGKDYAEATNILEEVLKEDPNNLDALLLRSAISISNKDFESAIVDLRVVLRDKPDQERAMELLAVSYASNNEEALARETLFKILKLNPLNVNAANQYALLHLKEKKYQKVIEVLQPLEQVKKLDNRGFSMLMQARLSTKDWSGAEKLAEQNQSKDITAYKTYIKALILQGQEKYNESNQLLLALLDTDPSLEVPLAALITNYNLQNDLATGIDYLKTFIEKNPSTNSLAYTLLAKAYLELKEPEKAIDTYKKMIVQKPDDLANYKALADIYMSQNKTEETIAIYQRALKQQPDALIYRFHLAVIYEQLKQNQLAIEQYAMILDKQPESTAAINNMASLLSYTGNSQDLEKAYNLAKQFENTKIPYYADTLGWIYYLKGDIDKAIALLKVAVENKSDEAIFNYHLGKAYMEKNDLKNAKKYIEKSIELGKSKEKFAEFDDAQAMLNKLL